jgi:hypothetical protein
VQSASNPTTASAGAIPPPPAATSKRKIGLSPISWLLILAVVVIPAIFWVTSRSGSGEQKAVLVATRTIPAFSVIGPGDLKVVVEKGASDALPPELPFTGAVTLQDIEQDATLSRTDVASISAPSTFPRDPVVIQLDRSKTLPSGTPVGRHVTIYGASGQQRFAVPAVLISSDSGPEHSVVFLLARSDVKAFGTALNGGTAITSVDVTPR